MKTLKDFKDTFTFFTYVDSLIQRNKKKAAGELAEEYWGHWHKLNSDYLEVYNTNDVDSIPYVILEKINAVDLLKMGGSDSYGIDKICLTRTGEIDIHQDKSALLGDKNASAKLAEGMMSLKDHPLKNVRHYVLNTTYKDTSSYFEVWKEDKPLIYKFGDFVPADDNDEAIEQDKQLWNFIKSVNDFNYVAPPLKGFIPRNSHQTKYVDTILDLLIQQFDTTGSAKGYAKGAGALGKSVLDSVIMARMQNSRWSENETNSPAPLSVTFFHSSKTISDNGSTEVAIRKDEGIYDKVIVVSGTDVIDGEDGTNLPEKFEKTTNAVATVEKIIEAMDMKQSVLILTLYHHSEIIAEINRLLKKEYKGFKIWARRRDECDWPCSNYYSSFAPALDKRTDSCVTFGSSGTDRFGDPLADYGTNNQTIHGPLLYEFTWAQAEKTGLVKPLCLITPIIKMSEIVSVYPDIVDKDGNLDYTRTVDGVPVDNTYPTVMDVVKVVGVQKAMIEHPAIKRSLMFSGRVKKNQLIKKNWKTIAKKHLGTSKLEKEITNLHHEVINDEQYNTTSFKGNHTQAIKRAKSKERYVMSTCKAFNRGYNDVAPHGYKREWLKHNAGFHISARSEVNLVQEIWRFVRLDNNDSDKFSYYICPIIINDINIDNISWEESSIDILKNIFKYNRNIADEFISIAKKGATKNQQTQGQQLKFALPEDFDPSHFEHLVNIIAHKSQGTVFPTMAREAHDWLTNEYLKLEDPTNSWSKNIVHKEFYKIAKFKPLYALNKLPNVWRERFFNNPNDKYGTDTWRQMNDNLLQYKKYCKQQKIHKANIIATVSKIVDAHIRMQPLRPEKQITYVDAIKKHFNISLERPMPREDQNRWYNTYIAYTKSIDIHPNKCVKNLKIIDSNTKKIFDLILKLAKSGKYTNLNELAQQAYDDMPSIGVNNTGPYFSVGSIRLKLIQEGHLKKNIAFTSLSQDYQNTYISTLNNIKIENPNSTAKGWIIGTPIDSNKEIIKVKASQTLGKVLKKFNMSEGAVSGCLRGTRNHHKGYTWTREEQDA